VVDGDTIRIGAARFRLWWLASRRGGKPGLEGAVLSFEHPRDFIQPRRTMEDRTMKTYTVTYNVTLTIEVQANSVDEAERLADRELPSHCDVDCAVVCHRIATSPERTREDN
jgi:hypothetical protein